MTMKLEGTVTIPRRLAYRIWGLLAQECSPCMQDDCQITRNPAEAIDQCCKEIAAALDGAGGSSIVGEGIRNGDTK